MNKFYWIPAVGEPKLIESEESVNKVIEIPFFEKDIGSLSLSDIDLINSLLEV